MYSISSHLIDLISLKEKRIKHKKNIEIIESQRKAEEGGGVENPSPDVSFISAPAGLPNEVADKICKHICQYILIMKTTFNGFL